MELLTAALRDKSWAVHQEAVRMMEALGKSAIKPTIAALMDRDSRVRESAAKILGNLNDPYAVEPLTAALRDQNSAVRRAAVEALELFGDPRAVRPLRIALWEEDNDDVCWIITQALVKLDESAVELFIAIMQDEDSDSNVRQTAAWALGELDDHRAIEPLIAALQDRDSNIRLRASEALGLLGNSCAVEPLNALLRKETEGNVRQVITQALGNLGEPAVEPLIATLKDEEGYVRQTAAQALIEIGEPSVEPLIATLQDEDSYVRQVAVSTLGAIDPRRAVAPVISALQDKDSNVRRAAVETLEGIGTPEALVAIEETTESLEPLTPTCPRCGNEMVLRTAKRGSNRGNQFWGCPSYPRCRGMRQYEPVSQLPVK
jgi:HEAT repeat protein